jgi:hypothetical protein
MLDIFQNPVVDVETQATVRLSREALLLCQNAMPAFHVEALTRVADEVEKSD